MTPISAWSTDPEENAAVDSMYQLLTGLAALLHDTGDARYADPSGGFALG